MEELAKIISTVGFPIVISLYLLVRVESKLDILTNSINSLSNNINNINNIHNNR